MLRERTHIMSVRVKENGINRYIIYFCKPNWVGLTVGDVTIGERQFRKGIAVAVFKAKSEFLFFAGCVLFLL